MKNGYINIVRLLIKKGAKIMAKDKYENTALDIVNSKLEKLKNSNNNNNNNNNDTEGKNNKEIAASELDSYTSIKEVLESRIEKSIQPELITDVTELFDNWDVIIDGRCQKELENWKKDDINNFYKIQMLIEAIKDDPFRGLGRVECLRGNFGGLYSRRINKCDQLIYEVDGEKVYIQSCRGHYDKLPKLVETKKIIRQKKKL